VSVTTLLNPETGASAGGGNTAVVAAAATMSKQKEQPKFWMVAPWIVPTMVLVAV